MPFFQMDDGFDSDPRVMRAGTAAFGLYSRCGIWVAGKLQDGFVPTEIAALYGTREWIERLVTTGLWSPVEGGFVMPDYLKPHGNWPAEKILTHRAAAAERKAKSRSRQVSDQHDDMSQRDSRVTHKGSHSVSPRSPYPSHTHTSFQEVEDHPDDEQSSPPFPEDDQQDRPIRPDVMRVCNHLADRIAEDGSKRPNIGKTWHDAARLLIDKDQRAEEQIHAAIDWCQGSDFWRANVLSMPKLREKYDQMRKQAMARNQQAAKPATVDLRIEQADQALAELKAEYANGTRRPFGLPATPAQLDFSGLMKEIEP